MTIYVDISSLALVRGVNDRAAIIQIEQKRGDASPWKIVFVENNQRVILPAGTVVAFGAKTQKKYDSELVVYESGFTLTDEVIAPHYAASPSFNSVALNTILAIDADAENDLPFIDLMAEVTWGNPISTAPTTTKTFRLRVHNDIVRGDEGSPTNLATPIDWLEDNAAAVVTAIGAVDSAAVTAEIANQISALTPQAIGAETPEGAQAKADAIAEEINAKLPAGVTWASAGPGEPQLRSSGVGINALSIKNLNTATESYSAIAFEDPGSGTLEKAAVGVGRSDSALYPWRSVYFESWENGDNNLLPLRLVQSTSSNGGYKNYRRIDVEGAGNTPGDIVFYSGTGQHYPNESVILKIHNDGKISFGSLDGILKGSSSASASSIWGGESINTSSFIATIGTANVTQGRRGNVEIYSNYAGGSGRIVFGSHNNGTLFREVGYFENNTGRFVANYDAEIAGKLTASNFKSGIGSPEGVVTAPIGSIYTRTDGGAGATLYVKESGSGNTGWSAK